VDWDRVAGAGYSFAYVKATEGVDSPDPAFPEHWKRLPEVGLRRGAYHFYVTEDDPKAQARFFLDTVEHRPGDLLPAVDVEIIGHGTAPGLADRLRTFLDLVETELGVRPVIYTSPKFWDAHLGPGFHDHPLWVAEYEVDSPRVPESWTRWTFWQWKDDHDVPGVEKDADVSRLHPELTLDDLVVPHRK
jgi:lysozyme